MAGGHSYTVADSPARVERTGGTRVDVTAEQMPLLDGIAFATLNLNAGAAREPHWHPNAAELTYCAAGSSRITIVEPGGSPVTFTVGAGDLFFVPAGFLHGIEAAGGEAARFLICFSDERPEDLDLSTSLTNMPGPVLGASFEAPAGSFDWVEPVSEPAFITVPGEPADVAPGAASTYRYEVEAIDPQVQTGGGSIRFARGDDFPVLDGLAMYSLRFNELGVREPHWHPNCAEFNYVVSGRVKMTIVSPGGDADTFELSAGDVSYIPPAYFHHIESLVTEEVHMCVFFNHQMPGDNGIAASVSGFSPEFMASVFGRPVEAFESLPSHDRDVLLSPPT